MRTLVALLVMVSAASADPSPPPPRPTLLSFRELAVGTAIGLDGSWLTSIALCSGKPRLGAVLSICADHMIGRTVSGAWQGDWAVKFVGAYELMPNVQVRSSNSVSLPLVGEGIARGIRAIKHANDDDAEAAADAMTTAGRSPFPWYALHISSGLGVRYTRGTYFVELEASYHYRIAGSVVDWQQPEGPYLGVAFGISREWISSL